MRGSSGCVLLWKEQRIYELTQLDFDPTFALLTRVT